MLLALSFGHREIIVEADTNLTTVSNEFEALPQEPEVKPSILLREIEESPILAPLNASGEGQGELHEIATTTRISEPKPTSEAIKSIVVDTAEEYGVNKQLALDLCGYEAKGCQPEIKNPRSSATGLYQFLTGTWNKLCEGDRTDAKDNATCAMKLISEGGITHWTADLNTRRFLMLKGYIYCSDPEHNGCTLK
jgi:hypothetical protein